MVTPAGDRQHFLELGKIPVVNVATPLGRVCELVGRQQVGGVIVRRRAQPTYYLTAPFLERAVRDVAARKGFKAAAEMPVSEYLQEFRASAAPIKSVALSPDIVHRYPIEVVRRPVQLDADVGRLLTGVPRVFSVQAGRRQAGWLLNHEWLARTVALKPPTWRCTNPEKQHDNYDFDHGRCSYCPFPLAQ